MLSLAADSLSEDAAPFSGRTDIVTGTKLAGAGNFFVWFCQGTSGNEGYFPTTYSSAYKTTDNGDVQAVLTRDVTGTGTGIDIIVGTKSPTANQGTIEIWKSDNAATPTYAQYEVYPPSGGIPGNNVGEVNAMQLSDLRKKGDGKFDLVVGTRTGSYSGQLLIFDGKAGGANVFNLAHVKSISGVVTSLTCADYNLDNFVDIVIGVQTGTSSGELQFWENKTNGVNNPLNFGLDTTLTVPGIPLSLASGDLGSQTNPDIVFGYRTDEASYGGGALIYYMDGGTPSSLAVDPSGGTVTNMVPTVIINNFNYGVKPSLAPAPYFLDIAAGVKSGASTGSLQLFLR